MPPRFAPTRLVDYPWVVVRVACALCGRAGAYCLARLAARYGPEQSLDGLLRDLCHTCPWYNERARKYEPRCGACFVDLERHLPPADHPDEPLYRQRQPGREDVPKPPPTLTCGGPTLAMWSEPRIKPLLLTLICMACGRREAFRLADLRTRYGAEAALSAVVASLTVDCLRRQAPEIYGQCRALLLRPERSTMDDR